MRESLAYALNSSHLEQETYSCSIDKIGSMGLAAISNELGVTAIRFIDGHHANSYKPLIYGLTRRASREFKCSRDILTLLCEQVVKEQVFPFCLTCNGRRELRNDEQVITCHLCHGSGNKRYTDLERALATHLDMEVYLKHWASRFQRIQMIYIDNYVQGLRETRKRAYG